MRFKLRIRSWVTLERVLLSLAVFAISSFALLEHVSIPIPAFSVVKWPLIYLGGACVLTQFNLVVKTFMKRKYFFVWMSLLLLVAVLFAAAYQNRDPVIGVSPMRNTMRTVLYLIELMMLVVWICEKNYCQYFIKYLFRYVLILVVLTDVVLFTGIFRFYSGKYEMFLIGSKFTVSYMHMNLLTLWVMQAETVLRIKQFSRIKLCLALAFLVAVSLRVECMTGIIGCVLLFICLFIADSPKVKKRLRALSSPVILNASLGVNLAFPFLSEALVAIPFVNYFVVKVLGRSENLTGRTNIFNLFGEQMSGYWAFGYGMGNQNVAAMELFGYANTQNAMLQWILQGGILVTIALVLYFNQIFVRIGKSGNGAKAMPMVLLIYVYIVLGFVETTFSMSFLFWLAVLLVLIYHKPKESERITPEVSVDIPSDC